jgi:hypothetical protein
LDFDRVRRKHVLLRRSDATLNYVSPVQFEQDWMDATVQIAP